MVHVHDKAFRCLIDRPDIEARIAELAAAISEDYAGRQPLFVAVLTGGFLFAAELMKGITIPCEITFIRLGSYQGTQSTGRVREIMGLQEDLRGRDVVIIEDIVDTGHTMAELLGLLTALGPRSVEIATLLHKPEATRIPVTLKYIGFNIENRFVVGYGLDYDGLGRNLPCLFEVVA